MTRSPFADDYDAVVGLGPWPAGESHGSAWVLVKRTFRIVEGSCELGPAEPLLHDIRDEQLDPRLPVGSDFWTQKRATDVVVLGSAFAPGGRPREAMDVRCVVGERDKRLRVFGTRHIEWTAAGRPFLGPPEPFTEVAVTKENAYGGFDARVPVGETESWVEVVQLLTDHPGMYPRNPFGKGYFVVNDRFDGIELPNLEDPDDLLTDERLIVVNPRMWPYQPLPWTLDWHHPLMFPRYVYLGADARSPAPDDELKEVARGFLERGCRAAIRQAIDRRDAESEAWLPYYQEASLGMVFDSLEAGCPIAIEGMHPERRRIAFELPAAPTIELAVEGQRESVGPHPTQVVIEPAADKLSVVYFARTSSLPRAFVPGIHKHIPVAAYIDGGDAVRYEPPATLRERRQVARGDAPRVGGSQARGDK